MFIFVERNVKRAREKPVALSRQRRPPF
ncbi:hypothetical protein ACS0PU_011948 [Formica fusca]